ncbi:tubulin monoglycylase TTLL3-like [Xenopus laevis]|uniref:Tubulin monoglycylase TTLL3-like n=1 Tax=Xenopus laevis TaxID=8355 RepID=A0A8J1MIV6_XENLA|nr:tubulin monoglycylase TTLL3-like [Xenopus laevis]
MCLYLDDFSMTAACGILKWVLRRNEKSLQNDVIPRRKKKKKARTVPEDIIVTALVVCQLHLYDSTHEDGDDLVCSRIINWEQFIYDYYQVMHHGAHIRNSDKYVDYCHQLLCKLRRVNPQLDIDGEKNIWILKPRALSRGRGKRICEMGTQLLFRGKTKDKVTGGCSSQDIYK